MMRTGQFVLGVVFLGLVALLLLVTIVLPTKSIVRGRESLVVRFEDASGLRQNNVVYVLGVQAGWIEKIVFNRQVERPEAHILLTRPVELYRDCRIEIMPSSFIGGTCVMIHPGTLASGPLSPETTLTGKSAPDAAPGMKNLVRTLNETVDAVVDGKGTIGKLYKEEDIYVNLKKIYRDWFEIVKERRERTPALRCRSVSRVF